MAFNKIRRIMTKQMMGIRLRDLPVTVHAALIRDTAKVAERHEAVAAKLSEEIDALQRAAERESGFIGQSRKSFLTDGINEQDRLRDNAYRGLRHVLRGYMRIEDKTMRAAAVRLWQRLKDAGVRAEDSLIEESGGMDRLCRTLAEDCSADITLLSLTPFAEQMTAANDELSRLSMERSTARANVEKGGMAKARKAGDEAFRTFRKKLNALATLDDNEDYETCIDQMNGRLLHLKQNVLKHRKRSKGENKEDGGE